ncbi:MAG: hypothetical protein IOD12_11770 [Silvanigrellales bacterium]|nr:hypothetical protein [Silvanigrellales bacterium]
MTKALLKMLAALCALTFAVACGKADDTAGATSLVSVRVSWNAPHPEAGFQPRTYEIAVSGCAGRENRSFAFDANDTGVLSLDEGDTRCNAFPSRVTYADAKGNTRVYVLAATPKALAPGGSLTLKLNASGESSAVSLRVQLGSVLPTPLPSKATIAFGVSPVKAMGAGDGVTELGHFKGTATDTEEAPNVPLVLRSATESASNALEGNRAFFVSLSCEDALEDDRCAGKSLLDFRYRFLAAEGAFESASAASSSSGARLSATEARALFENGADDRRPTIAHFDGNGLRVLVEDATATSYVFAVQWNTAVRVFRFEPKE